MKHWLQGQRLKKLTFAALAILSIFAIYSSSLTQNVAHFTRGDDEILMHLSQCGCQKWVKFQQPQPNVTSQDSTCSIDSSVRGPGQKVVAFTFYEPVKEEANHEDKNRREYFQGIEENVKLVHHFYGPDWLVRVYYQVSPQSPALHQLCDLACSNPNLDICDANSIPKLGNASILYPLIWRFLPVIDTNVDFYLSRDLDSRINPREAAAVEEFMKSDKDIHVMRDHPAHGAYILGGTWGAKVDHQRTAFKMAFKKMFQDGISYVAREKGGGYDQIALTRYVWPWAKKVALSHDSYTCHKFSKTSAFPTQREAGVGNFIGSVFSLNSSIGLDEGGICPEKCRPKDHPDWIYC